MSNKNWIKFEEAMPKLNHKIEVKTENLKTYKCTLLLYYYAFHSFGFKLSEENDLPISDTPIFWRYLKSENDKTDNWTLFEDKLPKLGELIEICGENGKAHEGKIILLGIAYFTLSYKNDTEKYDFNNCHYNKWRYKKEKKPDFNKLKEGDIISFNMYEPHEKVIGIISVIDDDTLSISPFENYQSHNSYTIFTDKIKKIIRINLESKTFEEI